MAAFGTSYQSALDNDIRHMYSSAGRLPVRKYHKFYVQRVQPAVPLWKRYPRRYYDFYPEYDIGIPRAPAFRALKEESLEELVQRLRKPITCQSNSGRRRCRERLEDEEPYRVPVQTKSMNSEEVDKLTKRLQRKTKCSQNRAELRAGAELQLPPINLRNSVGLKRWMN